LLAHVISSSASGKKIESEFTLAAAHYRLSQLSLVRREDLDALSASRDGDIPLLRVRRSANGGIGEQHMIDCLALRSIRRDGIPTEKLPIMRRKDAPVR